MTQDAMKPQILVILNVTQLTWKELKSKSYHYSWNKKKFRVTITVKKGEEQRRKSSLGGT